MIPKSRISGGSAARPKTALRREEGHPNKGAYETHYGTRAFHFWRDCRKSFLRCCPVIKISKMLLVCAIAGVSACDRGEAIVEPVDAVPAREKEAVIEAPQIANANTPEGYLVGACYDDLYLVAAARAIKARTQDPKIKALADSLETEHRALLVTQSAFLARLGTARAPSRLSARHAAFVADLDAAVPQELDRLWLTQQLTVLLESSLLHTNFSLHADDPRLKAHAQAASLSAQNHLDEVRRLGGDELRPLDS